MTYTRIAFLASDSALAQEAYSALSRRYGDASLDEADAIVVLGGDGFMLRTLQQVRRHSAPVYGMNRGTVGFLMNTFSEDALPERLEKAQLERLNPLRMEAEDLDGKKHKALAINEVALRRTGALAAKLRIFVDGLERLDELACDGALVATPAGSTAYNYSAHGPILPIGCDVLALTAIAAYRPRRWRGALLRKSARVRLEVINPEDRPVHADADGASGASFRRIAWAEIRTETRISHKLLFDPGHGLEERLISEQFT